MSEPRTIRELREAIQAAEAELERLHMSPAAALAFGPEWYLRSARLKLRQADIRAAEADDPRLEPLPPLRAQLRDPRPRTQPNRRRYRCPVCFVETLLYPEGSKDCWRRACDGVMEPVAALRRRKA